MASSVHVGEKKMAAYQFKPLYKSLYK